MKKRINLQFMILTLAAIIATVTMSTVVFYGVLEREILNDLKTYTQLMVETDAWEIITDPVHVGEQSAGSQVSQLRITLIGAKGEVIFDNSADVEIMENHKERPEISDAFKNGEGFAIRKSETLEKSSFYYAKLLNNGSVLRVAKEVKSLYSLFLSMFPLIAVICIFLFAICIILSNILTKSIVRPIEHLADNLDDLESAHVYKELVPFVATIRRQHEDIMRNANMRQEFTANVSHELKTPLTSISGYSELIESGMATEDDVKRFAKEIHKSSKRLLSLINDIIRLSELDQTSSEETFESVDLYETAQNCIDMLKMSAQKNNVTLSIEGESKIVTANGQMIEELIYNLCDNAIRYNNPDGTVTVAIKEDYDNIYVEVKDTGIGISDEHKERIFERFYRVDKSRSKSTGGTGLGLAIVKHIVARHENAEIKLESEVGKGTTVTVAFKKA